MGETDMTLDKLPVGQTRRIAAVGGQGALRRRLLDMGLTPKTQVTCLLYTSHERRHSAYAGGKARKSGRAGAEKSRRPRRKGEACKKNRGAQNHRQTGEGRIGVPAFCSRRAQRGGEPT